MNHQPIVDLVSRNPQITGLVSKDHEIANLDPLSRTIESLIHPSIEPKRGLPYFTRQFEIVVAFFKRL
jgi:hypothetical protein